MPHPKWQSSPNRKRMTERQIILARRSRSVKASLLKVLSLDFITLYQADQAKGSDTTTPRNLSQPIPHQPSGFHNPTELRDSDRSALPNLETSVRPVAHSSEPNWKQVQNRSSVDDSRVVSRPATEKPIGLVMVRCLALLLGVLTRCALIFYLQPFAALLSGVAIALTGVAIALSGIAVLIVVVFTPWKKKLLWNLSCLFGGLLLAVLML